MKFLKKKTHTYFTFTYLHCAVLLCACLFFTQCLKLDFTSEVKEPDTAKKTADTSGVTASAPYIEGGETRTFTFPADRQYTITFSIPLREIASAEKLLKAIDNESNRGLQGTIHGIDGKNKDFLPIYWHRIYHDMYALSRPLMQRLAALFRQIKEQQGLTDMQFLYVLVRFVQHMQYEIPPGIGIYSPARVLYEPGKGADVDAATQQNLGWNGSGDCDTKSLFLVLLLRECGFSAVVLDSYRYHHAMAAVSMPGIDGSAVEHRGRSYYVIETTYPPWNVGQLPQQYSDLQYFLPIDPAEPYEGVERVISHSRVDTDVTHGTGSQGPSEREPNNERETADHTGVLVIRGSLDEEDTADWYRLNGQETQYASFTIAHGPESNFDVQVFNDTTPVGNATGTTPVDTVSCSLPGQCYVVVRRVSGSGRYTLYISPGGSEEKEPNNTPESAEETASSAVYGTLDSQEDMDCYRLRGQEGFNATFTIYHEPGNDFNMEVYNDGRRISTAEGTASGDRTTTEIPGKCVVRILSARGSGWYLLTVRRNK